MTYNEKDMCIMYDIMGKPTNKRAGILFHSVDTLSRATILLEAHKRAYPGYTFWLRAYGPTVSLDFENEIGEST